MGQHFCASAAAAADTCVLLAGQGLHERAVQAVGSLAVAHPTVLADVRAQRLLRAALCASSPALLKIRGLSVLVDILQVRCCRHASRQHF